MHRRSLLCIPEATSGAHLAANIVFDQSLYAGADVLCDPFPQRPSDLPMQARVRVSYVLTTRPIARDGVAQVRSICFCACVVAAARYRACCCFCSARSCSLLCSSTPLTILTPPLAQNVVRSWELLEPPPDRHAPPPGCLKPKQNLAADSWLKAAYQPGGTGTGRARSGTSSGPGVGATQPWICERWAAPSAAEAANAKAAAAEAAAEQEQGLQVGTSGAGKLAKDASPVDVRAQALWALHLVAGVSFGAALLLPWVGPGGAPSQVNTYQAAVLCIPQVLPAAHPPLNICVTRAPQRSRLLVTGWSAAAASVTYGAHLLSAEPSRAGALARSPPPRRRAVTFQDASGDEEEEEEEEEQVPPLSMFADDVHCQSSVVVYGSCAAEDLAEHEVRVLACCAK